MDDTGSNGASRDFADHGVDDTSSPSEMADGAQAAFDQFRRTARTAYGQTREQVRREFDVRARQARERMDLATDLIEQKPMEALGLALFVGLTLGLLIGSGRGDRLVLVERCAKPA
jgi:ElaB/YqjD/DUF883 family membrane-anchored ribosome-binding protein